MKTNAELRDELFRIKQQVEALDERAKRENRAFTPGEQREYDALLTAGENAAQLIEEDEAHTEQLARSLGARNARASAMRGAPAIHVRGERRPYSLMRAIRGMISRDYSEADLERRTSDELAERRGDGPKHPGGLIVPRGALYGAEQRVIAKVTPNTTGAAGIATDLLENELIELLRNDLAVGRAGARILPGLVGDVSIPRQNAGASAAFLANEDTAVAESSLTLNNVTLSPKTVGLKSTITRRMLLQNSVVIEDLVRADIRAAVATAIDQAAINGSGAGGNPTGIITTAGIGGVTTAGAIARSHLLEFESDLGAANALRGKLAFLMRNTVRALLRSKQMVTGQPVFFMDDSGQLVGYTSFPTEQMPASNLLFGNFEEVLIGVWGDGLDLFADPYSVGDKGHVVIRGFQDVDVAVRHAASFSLATDVTG